MIMKMNFGRLFLLGTMALAVTACSEDDSAKPYNPNDNVGKNIGNFTSAEWYPGGERELLRMKRAVIVTHLPR